jgi:3-hydroxyacyl-[acyl-carrier-protein] dehydratase
MPPRLLVDLDTLDLDTVTIPIEEIRKTNAQRFEMEQLSGIIKFDREAMLVVGYKDVGGDEFWVRGHIPGRPLMPGVIMVEAAAQLCTFVYKHCFPGMENRFIGFGGIDGVKFRGTVVPGDRLIVIAKATDLRSRRAVFDTQAVVKDRMVYEGKIIGMAI